jgi:hypothetical protein
VAVVGINQNFNITVKGIKSLCKYSTYFMVMVVLVNGFQVSGFFFFL